MITKYLANKLQDYLLGGVAYTPPTTLYVGLSKAEIAYDGTGFSEPVGNAYARVAVTNDKINWKDSLEGVVKNKTQVLFTESTGDWGVCTHIFISDAATGGNIMFSSPLNVSRDIKIFSQLFFNEDGFDFSLTSI